MAGPATWGYQVLGFGAGKKPASAGASTTKVKVRFADFDENDGCACSLSSSYEVWENDPDVDFGGGDLDLAVSDWVSGYDEMFEQKCAQVTEINCAETSVGFTEIEFPDCDTCNNAMMLCEDMGGGGGEGGGP